LASKRMLQEYPWALGQIITSAVSMKGMTCPYDR
ncbi:MAG: hypothetical protein ACI831_001246, partial [Candidatus Azotimanducaceae bacterium]